MGDASLHRCTIASANQSATTSAVVKAPLVRALLVKQRYTMYLALPFLYECVYNSVQMWYTIQHRTVLIILASYPPDNHHSSDSVSWREGARVGMATPGMCQLC